MNIEQIDRYCDQYEQRLKSGAQLTPQQFLDELELSCADGLLEELNKLEREYRSRPTPGQGENSADVNQPTAAMRAEGVGQVIGGYKLLQQIGEGGMGVVYMAAQSVPIKRRVALKIIKPGMDTKEVLARFEAERQALGMMDHPNIARVLDGGSTGTGQPYFVMELVKGVPITKYCDEQRLSTRQRLELFVPVCQAVQHAHQKGIIHRDLKPTNVLVAQYDDQAVPKIIDFGMAKALSQELTEKTVFTQYGQIVGTIDYMSPEQATFNQLDVDTRTDIYSLGVLLYELLTGSTPFDKKRLRSVGFEELLRIIQSEEPPRPSTRLSSTAALPSVAANRRIEAKKLSGLVRGELDWIVMKALEKDRTRRYETANGLALDVQRYLHDEPVFACPPSVSYRLGKIIRRNKVAAAITVTVVFALMSLAAAGVQALNRWDIMQARDRAEFESVNAQESAKQAHAALEKEAEANRELLKVSEEKEQYLYFSRIGLAEREWFINNHGRNTRQYLNDCPVDKRGWEWRCLDRLAHGMTQLPGREMIFISCAFSSDGSYVAASDYKEGLVWVFDCRNGQEVLAFQPPGFKLNCDGLAISPDGKWLAAAAGNEHLNSQPRVWAWDRLLREGAGYAGTPLDCRTGAECNVSFSADSRYLAVAAGGIVAAASWVGVFRTSDFTGDDPPRAIWTADALPGYTFNGVALSPDGRYVCTGEGMLAQGFGQPEVPMRLFLWEWEKDRELARPIAHHGEVNDVEFSPDGRWLASSSGDGTTKLWAWNESQEILSEHLTLRGHTAPVRAVAFEPGATGTSLVTCSEDRTLKIWDRESGKERLTLAGHSSDVYDVAFRPDGRLIASAGTDSFVGLWDINRYLLEGHSDSIADIAISSDGRWAVSASSDGTVRRWDLVSGESTRVHDLDNPDRAFECVAISPDDAWIAAGEGNFTQTDRDGSIFVWSANTGKLHFNEPDHNAIVWDVTFSRDSSRLATSGGQLDSGPGGINLWDVANRERLLQLPEPDVGIDNHSHPGVKGVCFSDDSTKLFGITRTSAEDSNDLLIRWDTRKQVPERESWTLPTPRAMSINLSLDGRLVAISAFGEVLVYDAENGGLLNRIPLHGGDTMDVAFSPDSRYLASAGWDKRIKLFDRKYEQDVLTLHGHTGPVYSLAFSPDGNCLYSTGADSVIRIWDATPRDETE